MSALMQVTIETSVTAWFVSSCLTEKSIFLDKMIKNRFITRIKNKENHGLIQPSTSQGDFDFKDKNILVDFKI